MKAQRGQSLVKVAVGLFLLAVLALVAWGALMSSNAGQSMTMWAAEAMDQLTANISYDPSTHALLKHGPAATAVQECIGRKGIQHEWTNPTNGRRAQLCQLDDGRWGLNIIESNSSPVTTFIKDKMSDISQVFQYLRNCGYIPPQ